MSDDSSVPSDVLSQLECVIESRKNSSPETSYVAQLLADAPESVSAKIIEEAYELVHAAGDEELPEGAIVREAADLVFHVLVLLGHANVRWSDVEAELSQRFGVSGLVEKRARSRHE